MVIAEVRKYLGKIKRYPVSKIKAKVVKPKGQKLGYQVVHCTKKGVLGKPINATKKPVTYKKALKIHKAIMWRRKK